MSHKNVKQKNSRSRWWLRIAIVLLAIELLYVAGANIFLNTSSIAGDLINRRPERIHIEWDSAWTVVPGLVHVKNLRFRNQTRRVQSYIEVDKTTVLCALTALTQRTFRTHWLRARGITAKARPRPDDLASIESIRPYFPEIPGLELTAAQEMPRRAMKRPWRIQLDGMSADGIRDVWFANFRIRGNASASGTADIITRADVSIPAASGEFAFDSATFNEQSIGKNLNGQFTISMTPFVPRQNPGIAFFKFLSGELQIAASVDDLAFINYYLSQIPWLQLSGSSELAGRVVLDKGLLASGTQLEFEHADMLAQLGDYVAKGRGNISGHIAKGEQDTADTDMLIHFNEVNIRHQSDADAHFLSSDFGISVSGESFVIGGAIPPTTVKLNLLNGTIPNFNLYNRYLPDGAVSIDGGSGQVSGALTVDPEKAHGQLQLVGTQVALDVKDKSIVSDLDLNVVLQDGNPGNGRFDFTGSRLQLKNAAIAGNAASDSWSGDIRLSEGQLHWPTITRRGNKEKSNQPAGKELPSGRVSLDGEVTDIGIINPLLAKGPRLLVYGPGKFQALLEVDKSKLADGSQIDIDSDAISLNFLDYVANGQGRIQAQLNDASGQSEIAMSANIASAALKRQGGSQNHVEKLSVSLQATGIADESINALDEVQARIDLEHGQVSNIQVYNSYLPENSMARLVSGQAQLNGWWELDSSTGAGEVTLDATDVVASIRDQLVTGALTLEGKLTDGDLKDMRFNLRDTLLTLSNVIVREKNSPPWSGSLKISNGKIRLSSPLEVDGVLDLSMQDTRPFVDLFGADGGNPKWVSKLFNIENVSGSTIITLNKRNLTLSDMILNGDRLVMRGQLRFADKNLDGMAYAKYRKFGAAVEFQGKEREWYFVKPKKKFEAYSGFE